jgi:hypothetical protein
MPIKSRSQQAGFNTVKVKSWKKKLLNGYRAKYKIEKCADSLEHAGDFETAAHTHPASPKGAGSMVKGII